MAILTGFNVSTIVKRIAVNTGSNCGRQTVDTLVNFITVTILISNIGTIGYGLIVLSQSLVAFIAVFKNGLFGGVGQRLAVCLSKQDYSKSCKIYSTSLLGSSVFGVIMVILGYVAACCAPQILNVPPEYAHSFKWLLFMIISAIGLSVSGSPIEAVLIACEQFVWWNSIYIIARICFLLVLLFTVLYMKMGVIGFGLSLMTWAFIGLIGCYLVVRKRYSDKVVFKLAGVSWSEFREVTNFSFFVFIRDLCFYLRIQAKILFINLLFGPEMNAVYGLAIMWERLIRLPTTNFVNVLMPQAAKLSAVHDERRLRLLFLKSCHYCSMVSLLLFFALMCYRETIFKLWLGELTVVTKYAMELTPILVFGTSLILCQAPAISTLQGVGKVKQLAFVAVTALVVDVIVTSYLLIFCDWHLVGFALGTMVNYAILSLIFLPVLSAKTLKIGLWEIIRDVYAYACLRVVLPVGIIFLSHLWGNYLVQIGGFILALLVFVFIWKVSLDNDEKRLLGIG